MMWTEISLDLYRLLRKEVATKPYSSFTDPDGDSPIGIGRPHLMTTWGHENGECELVKCESEKETPQDKWIDKYYMNLIKESNEK